VNVPSGAVVVAVESASPAANAGLKQADVITAIDGTPIVNEPDLALALSQHKPGDSVTLTVVRGSQKTEVKVTLGTKPTS
jgi:S1-C subfamily serine protease